MRALSCQSPGQFEYLDMARPASAQGRAIIKIRRVGICGTDLHAFHGSQPFFDYPRILGHELAGDLVDATGTNDYAPGQKVTIIPYFSCGACVACRRGKPNCCVQIRVCGVHIDGGMAEYLSVPITALVDGRDFTYDELALVEPFAIGAHAIRRAVIEEGENVLVVGAGPIGLAAMEFAHIAGASVIAMDLNESRLEFCAKRMGIKNVINPATSIVLDDLREFTNGDMPTLVIDATGNQQAINNGLNWLAHGGRYILLGLQKNELIFNHPEFHKRETTLMTSRNATLADFEQVLACMRDRIIDPAKFITHRSSFESLAEKFPTWLDPLSKTIKAVVELD